MNRVHKLGTSVPGLMYDHVLLKSMVQFTIKDGKKELAVRLINGAVLEFARRCKLNEASIVAALDEIVERIRVNVGFFKRRIGSRVFFVPYVLTPDRSLKHSLKRMYKLVRKSQKRGYVEALAQELSLIHRTDQNSVTIREKNRIYAEAKNGRALYQVISRFKLKDPERLRVEMHHIRPVSFGDKDF